MKNDLAYILSGTLSMYEHQSTYSLKLSDAFENKKVQADVELKCTLGLLLTEAGRSNEFLKSLSDRELQKKLFIEFGLEEGK